MEVLLVPCCFGVLFLAGIALAPYVLSGWISREQERFEP
jgi:hypothetical protein